MNYSYYKMSVIYTNELVLKGNPPTSIKSGGFTSSTELMLTESQFFDASDNTIPRPVVFAPISPVALNSFSEWDGRLKLKAGVHKITATLLWYPPVQKLNRHVLGFSSDTNVAIHNRTVKDTSSEDYRMVGINESTNPSLFFEEFIPSIASSPWVGSLRVVPEVSSPKNLGIFMPSSAFYNETASAVYNFVITLPSDEYVDFEIIVNDITATHPNDRARLVHSLFQSVSIISYSLPQ